MRRHYPVAIALLALALNGCFSDGSDPAPSQRNTNSTGIDNILGDDFDLNTEFRPYFEINVDAPSPVVLMPYPNDILGFLLAPDTDGTLNVSEAASFQVLASEINKLDGFSTFGRITANFSDAIDPASLTAPGAVTVLEVVIDPALFYATVGVVGPLVPGVDYSVGVSQDVGSGGLMLEIMPIKPLNPKSGYLVIVTNQVTDTSGTPAVPDTLYQNIKDALAAGITLPDPTLDALKQYIGAHLQIAGAINIDPASVVVTASFSTLSITDAFDYIDDTATAQFSNIQQLLAPVDIPLPDGSGVIPAGTPITTAVLLGVLGADSQCDATADFPLPGCGMIFVGGMNLPQYLTPPVDQNDASTVFSIWEGTPGVNQLDPESTTLSRYNPVPQKKADVVVPVFMSVPGPNSAFVQAGGTQPPTGWPTLIYVPGFTRDRLDMTAIAEPWNNSGFAIIAIDNPYHGITATDPAENPLALFRVPGTTERTYDLDIVQNDNPAVAEPDGLIDPNGIHFFNPAPDRILPSADKERQAVSDVIHLIRTIPTIDIDGDDDPDLDASRLHIVGDSLGGWAAIGAAVANDEFVSATSVYPAGGLSMLLFESPRLEPLADGLKAALAANGILPGTTAFNNYVRDLQNLVDVGDAVNYGNLWEQDQRIPIHMMMVAEDTFVVPESTRRVQAAMGLPQVPLAQPSVFPFQVQVGSTDPVQGTNGVNGGLTFMTQGDHGSFLSPAFGSPEVTIEMQTEALVFGAGFLPFMIPGDGQVILVSDPSVVDVDGQ